MQATVASNTALPWANSEITRVWSTSGVVFATELFGPGEKEHPPLQRLTYTWVAAIAGALARASSTRHTKRQPERDGRGDMSAPAEDAKLPPELPRHLSNSRRHRTTQLT